MSEKKIAILGSTGSIGCQALAVVAASAGSLQATVLAAGENIKLLREQIKSFSPEFVTVKNKEDAEILRQEFPSIKIASGPAGLIEAAVWPGVKIVLVAIVGITALQPTIAAIKQKKDIALASKEVLVAAGSLIMPLVKKMGIKLLPVDSEHSAIMQSINPEYRENSQIDYSGQTIEKIILTASGGAFRNLKKEEVKNKKFSDALAHPNWSMGSKITIDSATLMNKGMEVIEAHWLFGIPYKQIEVLIHQQSIVHSMVEFVDGSVIAQLGLPDMRVPIQYAFFYPRRQAAKWPKLDLKKIGALSFNAPDHETFKSLMLAYTAGQRGGTLPAVLNAANEEAVSFFSKEQLGFLDIPALVEGVMKEHVVIDNPTLEQIIAADCWAREKAIILKEKING